MEAALFLLLISFLAFLLLSLIAGRRLCPANPRAAAVSGIVSAVVPAVLVNTDLFYIGIRSLGLSPGLDMLTGYVLLGVIGWFVAVCISRELDRTRLRSHRKLA